MPHTPGPWKRIALGGCSTVVSSEAPTRADNRIPAYGYDPSKGHCIAYPFIEDSGGIRLDFVCFSHEDARLIAAAPELLATLIELSEALAVALDRLGVAGPGDGKERKADADSWGAGAALEAARAAIARAEGR